MVENEEQWTWHEQSYDEWYDEYGNDALANIAHGSMKLTNDDGYECDIEMSSLDNGDSDSSDNGNVSFWTYLYEDEKMFPRWSYETMTYWINGICIGNGEECLDEIYREDSQVRLKMDLETFAKVMLTIASNGEKNRYEKEKKMVALFPPEEKENSDIISLNDLIMAHRKVLNFDNRSKSKEW